MVLIAVGPSLLGTIWEEGKKGKSHEIDPNTVVPGWREFCRQMGVTKDIKVWVFPNLRNAAAKGSMIEIGQPVIDSLDNVSLKGVFAHELAHINGSHASKQGLLLLGVMFAEFVLLSSLFNFSTPHFPFFAVFIGLTGIAIRFITWPFEYRADLLAKQNMGRNEIIFALEEMGKLRNVNIAHDFYMHPSIEKRIANLD